MANWILFARSTDGVPVISAIQGENSQESLTTKLKADLIAFLNRFSGAGTLTLKVAPLPEELIPNPSSRIIPSGVVKPSVTPSLLGCNNLFFTTELTREASKHEIWN